jgi:hypothetical protein
VATEIQIASTFVKEALALAKQLHELARMLSYVHDVEASDDERAASKAMAYLRGDYDPKNEQNIALDMEMLAATLRTVLPLRLIDMPERAK